MSGSIYKTVRAALEKDDQQYLKDIEADLKKRINDAPKRTIDELLGAVNSNSFFLRFSHGILEQNLTFRSMLKRRTSFILTKIAL